jgi:hypothetical protein
MDTSDDNPFFSLEESKMDDIKLRNPAFSSASEETLGTKPSRGELKHRHTMIEKTNTALTVSPAEKTPSYLRLEEF